MQYTSKTTKLVAAVFMCVAFAALMIVRSALFYYESFDYIYSLSVWVSRYREMSFFEGLGTKVSNYNQPYMYLLNIFARIEIPDLFLIKHFSIVFDALLAFFVMKLVSLKSKSANIQILAFLLTFALPTVILNGAMWGQCDSVYTAFAIGSMYFALNTNIPIGKRSKMAYSFIALAISFKLQAAFILPVFIVFIMQDRIKLRDCYMFFLIYFGMLLPAFVAGFPIRDLLFLYFDQANSYHYLTLNAVNVWQFFANVEFEPFRVAGLYMGGTTVLGLMYFVWVNKERLTATVDYLRIAFLFAVIVPFMLPQMHDRFFYMADILALVVFLYDKRRWYVPLVCIFCSFITYAWLIMDYIYIFDYKLAALALAAVIFTVLRDLVIALTEGTNIRDLSETTDNAN